MQWIDIQRNVTIAPVQRQLHGNAKGSLQVCAQTVMQMPHVINKSFFCIEIEPYSLRSCG